MGTTAEPATDGPERSYSATRWAIAGAYFAQGCVFLSLTTRLPKFQKHWGISELGLTGIMLLIVLLAGAGSFIAETIAPRRGSALSLRIGLLLVTASLLITGPAPDVPVLLAGMAVYGVALGMVDASSNMQAVSLEHRIGRPILPSFYGAWTAGGIAGTLLTLATPHLSVAAVSMPLAVLPLVVAFGPLLLARGVVQPAGGDLGIPWRQILLVGAACVVFYMVDTAATTWGSVYFDHTLHSPSGLVALAALPYLCASLFTRVAGDRLADHFGAPTLLRVGAVVALIGLAVIVAAPDWPIGVAGFLVLGSGIAVVAPLSFSAAGVLARDGAGDDPSVIQPRVDAVIARFNQFNYVGALLGAVLTGAIGTGSLRVAFAVPAILVLALFPLAKAFRRPAEPPAEPAAYSTPRQQ
ncbi:MFS transporter [Rudaeicoccus suwonensis]|uniref:Putative MFS family arabinose efflux permease n=1 Tax=Rudaeicoccus suwonensis TaxID=657409 RepID=A0A561E0X3_9MICO|nr:MFS transporter [Rudaeicoccus suwonensis]TWE09244.1 putative MFS family arabinose efflux permease [Rudaeicoccus suwonensis]